MIFFIAVTLQRSYNRRNCGCVMILSCSYIMLRLLKIRDCRQLMWQQFVDTSKTIILRAANRNHCLWLVILNFGLLQSGLGQQTCSLERRVHINIKALLVGL